ncbi:unannotated protein [freshwater metagenome]|uniref:Unannotated protein n=1 Tax=freshwater metagenome TaxID=449393 RepID=A0A6J7JVK0_9ZZZZ
MDRYRTSNSVVNLNLFGKQVNIKTNDFVDQNLYWTNRCPAFNRRALIIIHAEQRQGLRQRTASHRLAKQLGTAGPEVVRGIGNTGNSKRCELGTNFLK